MPKIARNLNGWYKLRWKILERDKFTCQYCGQSAPSVMLEVDHKLSISEGGKDTDDNLVAACSACNRGKEGLRQWTMRSHMGRNPISKPTYSDRILEVLKSGGQKPKQIAIEANLPPVSVRVLLSRLKYRGEVFLEHDGKYYAFSRPEVVTPQSRL